MSNFFIEFDKESPQKKHEEVKISVKGTEENQFLYKFIEGSHGKWNILKDFSEDTEIIWIPEEDGVYTIMVQLSRDGGKSFEFVLKEDYIIGDMYKNIIKALIIDKKNLILGEKLNARIDAVLDEDVLYRYFIKQDSDIKILRDYGCRNDISWTPSAGGKYVLIAQCKKADSVREFDSQKEVEYEVKVTNKVQIRNFVCLNEELFSGSEITFEIQAVHEDSRMILYKFMKIDGDGNVKCLQDYSTKKILTYTEKGYGDFKILCFVKDMYSQNEFDDRALISYSVKKYREVKIESFTTDLSSPQLVKTNVNLKAVASGGKKLLYRYIIEGQSNEDSGYIYDDTYIWKGSEPGKYTLTLLVKDDSCTDSYEDTKKISFIIDKIKREPVKINGVDIDTQNKILRGKTAKIKVNAEGGFKLKYGFSIERDGKRVAKLDYAESNIIKFKSNTPGIYKVNVYVKDKYSDKDYDVHDEIYIKVLEYMPALIDYVLINNSNYYMVGNSVDINAILKNTKSALVRFVLKVDDRMIQDTKYKESKQFIFIPKSPGKYTIDVFAKNKNSSEKYDSKKTLSFFVHEFLPITDTKILCDKISPKVNETVTFKVKCSGGKENLYEFYLMENDEWKLMQKYSRKNFYSFMIFNEGKYRVLVLCKSQFSKYSYEDYDIIELDM